MNMENNKISQGSKANKNGHICEQTITPVLKEYGFILINYKEYTHNLAIYKNYKELAITSFPFTSIYNGKGKTEYVLKSKRIGHDVRIECKWQQAAGSVDEKFPYLYLNCVYGYPESEIWLLIDGNGYKKEARKWLEQVINDRWLIKDDKKIIRLFTDRKSTRLNSSH